MDLHLPARLLHRQEELHGQRHDHEIHHRRAQDEQREGPQQIGPERLALVLVEAGRHELVDLQGDQREGQQEGTEQGELQLGEEELVRGGVDHLDLLVCAARPHVRLDQQIVDVGGEGKADGEADADADQRIDHALAQLDQMIHQRRFGGLDLVVALGLALGHARGLDRLLHRSGSALLGRPAGLLRRAGSGCGNGIAGSLGLLLGGMGRTVELRRHLGRNGRRRVGTGSR